MAGKVTKNIDCCAIRNVLRKARWSLTAVVTYSRYHCIYILYTPETQHFLVSVHT